MDEVHLKDSFYRDRQNEHNCIDWLNDADSEPLNTYLQAENSLLYHLSVSGCSSSRACSNQTHAVLVQTSSVSRLTLFAIQLVRLSSSSK